MGIRRKKGAGMSCLVTGDVGFIGSHGVDRLLEEENHILVYDNLSTGKEEFIERHKRNVNFELVRGDLLDFGYPYHTNKVADIVIHLTANTDVWGGAHNTRVDLEQNTIATWNVLESMRRNNVKRTVFTSSGSIYGEPNVFPMPEDYPLIQTSTYGASKLAREGMIEEFCEAFDFQAWIFRFVSVLGERCTHGCFFNFYKILLQNPNELYLLGDDKQNKSYIHVGDCIDAMFQAVYQSNDRINMFSAGREDQATEDDLVDLLLAQLGLKNATMTYAGRTRGRVRELSPYFVGYYKNEGIWRGAKTEH